MVCAQTPCSFETLIRLVRKLHPNTRAPVHSGSGRYGSGGISQTSVSISLSIALCIVMAPNDVALDMIGDYRRPEGNVNIVRLMG